MGVSQANCSAAYETLMQRLEKVTLPLQILMVREAPNEKRGEAYPVGEETSWCILQPTRQPFGL